MSQRERLLGRRIPPTPVAIRVDFSAEADAAYAEHEAASRALQMAEFRGADLDAERARVDAAKAAIEPYLEVLLVAPVAPDLHDDLIGAHPPTDEQRKQGAQWDTDTFMPALLAACIGQELPEGERMAEKDWAEWASTASASASGELVTLFQTCVTVNDRSPDVRVGKG